LVYSKKKTNSVSIFLDQDAIQQLVWNLTSFLFALQKSQKQLKKILTIKKCLFQADDPKPEAPPADASSPPSYPAATTERSFFGSKVSFASHQAQEDRQLGDRTS
jgi:hypothetical protein